MGEIEYVTLPKYIVDKWLNNLEWEQIEYPTIDDVSKYCEVTIRKIKNDLAKYNCPLIQLSKGGKGKGNTKIFNKQSVESYKIWLKLKN